MSAFQQFFKCLFAEFYKLRGTPVFWLVLLAGLAVSLMMGLSFLSSPHHSTTLNINPWGYYFKVTSEVFSVFILVPAIVLTNGLVVYLEHKNNTWKGLYSLPIKRGYFYFSKLLTVILLVMAIFLAYFFWTLGMGYFMSFIFPEFEYQYYFPDMAELTSRFAHLTIGVLALCALQFWLSMRFKNFIIPLAIGIMGFIIGIFLFISSSKYGLYFPYTLPALVNDLDIIKNKLDKTTGTIFNKAEIASMGFFVLFSILGYVEERRRNVK